MILKQSKLLFLPLACFACGGPAVPRLPLESGTQSYLVGAIRDGAVHSAHFADDGEYAALLADDDQLYLIQYTCPLAAFGAEAGKLPLLSRPAEEEALPVSSVEVQTFQLGGEFAWTTASDNLHSKTIRRQVDIKEGVWCAASAATLAASEETYALPSQSSWSPKSLLATSSSVFVPQLTGAKSLVRLEKSASGTFKVMETIPMESSLETISVGAEDIFYAVFGRQLFTGSNPGSLSPVAELPMVPSLQGIGIASSPTRKDYVVLALEALRSVHLYSWNGSTMTKLGEIDGSLSPAVFEFAYLSDTSLLVKGISPDPDVFHVLDDSSVIEQRLSGVRTKQLLRSTAGKVLISSYGENVRVVDEQMSISEISGISDKVLAAWESNGAMVLLTEARTGALSQNSLFRDGRVCRRDMTTIRAENYVQVGVDWVGVDIFKEASGDLLGMTTISIADSANRCIGLQPSFMFK